MLQKYLLCCDDRSVTFRFGLDKNNFFFSDKNFGSGTDGALCLLHIPTQAKSVSLEGHELDHHAQSNAQIYIIHQYFQTGMGRSTTVI
jgi:hypothetical protein